MDRETGDETGKQHPEPAIFFSPPKSPPRTPPHHEISRNPFVQRDARDQGPHRQAPLHLALRRHQPRPLLQPLRHLLPSSSPSAAARRSSRLQPRPERVRCSERCCFPVHCPAAGLRGGPPSPGAAAAVLRRRPRLGFVPAGVLLGGNSLVYWCFSSILCCFGSPGEAWIDCLHNCFQTSMPFFSHCYNDLVAKMLVIKKCNKKH